MSVLDNLNDEAIELFTSIGETFTEATKSVVSMLVGADVSMTQLEMRKVGLDEFNTMDFDKGILCSASFTKKYEGEVFLLFSMEVGTTLVDMMLGGEGKASEDIEEDGLDALSETMNQIMGSSCQTFSENLGETVSFENVFSKKVDLKNLSDEDKEFLKSENFLLTTYEISVGEAANGVMYILLTEDLAEKMKEIGSVAVVEEEVAPPPVIEMANDPAPAPVIESGSSSSESASQHIGGNIDLLLDIELPVVVRMGRTEMPLAEVLKLAPGSLIELDKNADDPIDLIINEKRVAKGEVVIVDGNFALRITEISSKAERLKSLT
jgi:flagellar motor switch protein FliN/FliY